MVPTSKSTHVVVTGRRVVTFFDLSKQKQKHQKNGRKQTI
jgi:hypothetical protein